MSTTAKLIKRTSANGFMEMRDDIPLGKEYEIDPLQRRMIQAFHVPTKTPHVVEMVRTVNGFGFGGWMPVELLDWPGKLQ